MIQAEVIIVGGGPAGATCARELKKHGVDVLIVDKQSFPRPKLCAGWITPRVMADLDLRPEDYPHRILTYQSIVFHFRGVPVPVLTCQYSIRRFEFDDFLLKRANVPVFVHPVKNIRQSGGQYIIDDKFRCTWLVGAGGTHCPVYKSIFARIHPRDFKQCIATAEEEFAWHCKDRQCRLWFFDKGLPGYAWYVPKQKGYLNVGIGGKLSALKKRSHSISAHWLNFVEKLSRKGLICGRQFSPRGHIYYLRGETKNTRSKNAFLIGDAAALATCDMGEGIGPAIESGKIAARSIATGQPFSLAPVTRWSLPQILTGRWIAKKNRL